MEWSGFEKQTLEKTLSLEPQMCGVRSTTWFFQEFLIKSHFVSFRFVLSDPKFLTRRELLYFLTRLTSRGDPHTLWKILQRRTRWSLKMDGMFHFPRAKFVAKETCKFNVWKCGVQSTTWVRKTNAWKVTVSLKEDRKEPQMCGCVVFLWKQTIEKLLIYCR